MPEPEEFQEQFAQAIMARQAPAAMPAGFAVYRNTWLQALLDALAANYPVVAMLLGDELFERVALEFARDHPAETPALALYGEEFPDFLQVHDAGREIPYLRDVAQLERYWTECFFAPDAPMLEERDYAALKPAQLLALKPRLHPAMRVSRFETPAVTIWQAHRETQDFETLEPEWQAERALIARRGASITVTLIDEPTVHMLAAIRCGRSLGSALDSTAEFHPGADLSKVLSTVLSTAALTTHPSECDRLW